MTFADGLLHIGRCRCPISRDMAACYYCALLAGSDESGTMRKVMTQVAFMKSQSSKACQIDRNLVTRLVQ
eukprot:6207855-Amphidinium_carterae.1